MAERKEVGDRMGVVKVTAVRRRVAGKKSAQPNDSEANIAFVARTTKSGAPTSWHELFAGGHPSGRDDVRAISPVARCEGTRQGFDRQTAWDRRQRTAISGAAYRVACFG
jgi:hypothetical protein